MRVGPNAAGTVLFNVGNGVTASVLIIVFLISPSLINVAHSISAPSISQADVYVIALWFLKFELDRSIPAVPETLKFGRVSVSYTHLTLPTTPYV